VHANLPVASIGAQVLAAPGFFRLALDHDGTEHCGREERAFN
jgi:hypothetical protein